MSLRTAVVWDLDGTLVRIGVSPAASEGWKQRFAAWFGPELDPGGWSPLLPALERAVGLARDTKTGPTADEVYDALERWEAEAITEVQPIAATLEVASRCTALDIPQAIVTNNGRGAVGEAQHAIAAWAAASRLTHPVFHAVVHRSPDLPAKPRPDGLRRAVQSLESTSGGLHRVLVIGDSPGDWQAAAAFANDPGPRRVAVIAAVDGRLEPRRPAETERLAAWLHTSGLDPALFGVRES